MTKLTEIIDAASDDAFTTSNLLRKVQTVAFRLQAENLGKWAQRELFGYKEGEPVPTYRGPFPTPVIGTWSGPGGSQLTNAVSAAGIPEDFLSACFRTTVLQPVADLELLSSSEKNPSMSWDPYTVQEYARLVAEKKGGAGFYMMELISAKQTLPQNAIRGIIDSVRTTALQLALELERVSPRAGEPDGPTTADPEVKLVTNNFNFTINGDGNNVAAGSDIRQRATVNKGDIDSLVRAAIELGLKPEAVEDLQAAVLADGPRPGDQTSKFLSQLRTGGYALASGVSSNLAAEGILQAVGAFFGVPAA
ncbi:AbiTii domain-containing protein [Arthrobacter globiformis]|uniref:AbiTii domain-containing protein n=1 Tax=Arthrobacter globiformis TaxID=1665 RepID=UPI00278A0860|nr:hypothetical protein [Arthrobacter globiformis]MDQ0867411.1 hypothetical protein [Arthrobacter globiformis]